MTDSYDPRSPGALYPSLVVKRLQIRVWENVVCSRCGEEQETVFEEGLQIRDGLLLTVEGGYGMYVDTDDIHKLLLCGKCIAILRETWPGLDQVCNWDDSYGGPVAIAEHVRVPAPGLIGGMCVCGRAWPCMSAEEENGN